MNDDDLACTCAEKNCGEEGTLGMTLVLGKIRAEVFFCEEHFDLAADDPDHGAEDRKDDEDIEKDLHADDLPTERCDLTVFLDGVGELLCDTPGNYPHCPFSNEACPKTQKGPDHA